MIVRTKHSGYAPDGRRQYHKGGGGLIGAVLGAGLAYATGGASLMAGASLGASLGSTLLGGGQQAQTPSINIAAPATAPASQAASAPDASLARAATGGVGQGGGAPGVAQTFLTGVGGVDPGTLTLGKNTLLGQ